MLSKDEMISYIEQLADGIDPMTGEVLEKDTILNRSDIVRLFYSLRDYLLNDDKKIRKTKNVLGTFKLSSNVGIAEDKITTIMLFTKRLNDFRVKGTKPISYLSITNWLLKEVYLLVDEKHMKAPSNEGTKIGILYSMRRSSNGREYYVIEYSKNAQQFIVDNLFYGNIC